MYIYKLTEGNYEYQTDRLISHDEKYSEDEFKSIVIGAINYNNKHKEKCKWDNDIDDIIDTLETVYNFKHYSVSIQASVYDDWRLNHLSEKF